MLPAFSVLELVLPELLLKPSHIQHHTAVELLLAAGAWWVPVFQLQHSWLWQD
jgi:hypothetical protein